MGRGRRDKIYLTKEQRQNLEQISRNGHAPAKKILHARILLMSDEGEMAPRKWTDHQIAEALQVHPRFVPLSKTVNATSDRCYITQFSPLEWTFAISLEMNFKAGFIAPTGH